MEPLVIIVNYFTEADVHRQLLPFRDAGVRFVVVDNGSRDQSILESLHAWSNVRVFSTGSNLGYLNGGFFGLERYLEQESIPRWILVSNPDITFSPSLFARLPLIDSSSVAMLAPRIVSERTQKDQNPFMLQRPTRKKLHRLQRLHAWPAIADIYRLGGGFYHRFRADRPAPNPKQAIYAAHGSCMIISSEFLMKLPELSYPAFLYCEEIYLAEEARRLGLPIVYRPDLEVVHSEHRTTKVFRSHTIIKHHKEALEVCLRRYW
jgi:GT2 family glycosyltransferase